jgi:hypothetical protein
VLWNKASDVLSRIRNAVQLMIDRHCKGNIGFGLSGTQENAKYTGVSKQVGVTKVQRKQHNTIHSQPVGSALMFRDSSVQPYF